MTARTPHAFAGLLHASGPAPQLADRLALYGRFVGDWTMDVVYHLPDGATRRTTGSIHFGWVLQGRAIQDVWRIPAHRPGTPDDPAESVMYGTTLRVYDPAIDAWRITWADPVRQVHSRQIGRAEGDRIVQDGETAEGVVNRWSFDDITRDGFHWIGEERDAAGAWRPIVEFFARRVA